MIITELRGGLGNQIFQYATGRALAELQNDPVLKLGIAGYESSQPSGDTFRSYRLKFFNIKAQPATTEEVKSYKYPLGIISKIKRGIDKKIFRKFYMDYHPELMQNKNLKYLDGFFQSEKYFSNIREKLLTELTLKPEFISTDMISVERDMMDCESPISLHVRRADYVTNAQNKAHFGAPTLDYYKEAIRYMAEHVQNPTFFAFSDDIDWLKQNIDFGNNKVIYVSKPSGEKGLQDYEELILMSKCKHHIMANSSFSWWGAWLDQNPSKIVIGPKQWTVNPKDHPNITPDGWLRF